MLWCMYYDLCFMLLLLFPRSLRPPPSVSTWTIIRTRQNPKWTPTPSNPSFTFIPASVFHSHAHSLNSIRRSIRISCHIRLSLVRRHFPVRSILSNLVSFPKVVAFSKRAFCEMRLRSGSVGRITSFYIFQLYVK